MEDIIASIPYCCGESDCPQQWHMTHYWIYDDGSYSLCDCDGNHEGCEADDVPTHREIIAAWNEYNEYVIETGRDPLCEFSVRRHRKCRQRYTAWFQRIDLGWVLCRLRRGRVDLSVHDVAEEVCEYLHLVHTKSGAYRTAISLKEFGECEEVTLLSSYERCRASFVLEPEVPRSASAVAKDLRKAARRSLRNTFVF